MKIKRASSIEKAQWTRYRLIVRNKEFWKDLRKSAKLLREKGTLKEGHREMRIPMKSPLIPKQIGTRAEQSGNPRSRSEATLGFCTYPKVCVCCKSVDHFLVFLIESPFSSIL